MSNLVMGSRRELGTVGLVAGLSGAYAGSLIMTSDMLQTMADKAEGSSLGVILGATTTVFILIALYVATVVITNCVSTVMSGRLRHIALLRLLGSDPGSLRRTVRRATALVGALGAAVGLLVGTVLVDIVRVVLVRRGTVPEADYAWFSAAELVAWLAIVAAAALAGQIGARVVLTVSPSQAMGGAASGGRPSRSASKIRVAVTVLLVGVGLCMLVLSAWLGEEGSAAGFLMAFFGSVTTGTGLLVGARLVIPGFVALLSRLVGGDAPSLIARRNAVKDPMRTTRSTMGLVLGVTLVTTFAAGTAALRASLASWELAPAQRDQADQVMAMTAAVMICIVVISSVIAAVGFVSTMSLSVIQRGREIGLLRALGFTAAQVRSMITKESVALSAAAVTLGILLGLGFGAAGAQALVGSMNDGFVWGMPWLVLAIIAVSCVALVIMSSRTPARRAVSVSTLDALRIDA